MQIYHDVWLQTHPWRTREWLQARLDDGFAIHHIDGNHENNSPDNLLLIDASDHLHLHGLPLRDMARSASSRRKSNSSSPRLIYKKMRRLKKQLKKQGALPYSSPKRKKKD